MRSVLHHPRLPLAALAVAVSAGLAFAASFQATPSLISQDTAVLLALTYLRQGSITWSFSGEPTEIRGARMTWGSARQFLAHGSLNNPAVPEAQEMWVFVVRGAVALNTPPGPGSQITPAENAHQLSLCIDAHTGELRLSVGFPHEHEIATDTLPLLEVPPPSREVPPPPTRPSYPTAAPAAVTPEAVTVVTLPPFTPFPQPSPIDLSQLPTVTRVTPYPIPIGTPEHTYPAP